MVCLCLGCCPGILGAIRVGCFCLLGRPKPLFFESNTFCCFCLGGNFVPPCVVPPFRFLQAPPSDIERGAPSGADAPHAVPRRGRPRGTFGNAEHRRRLREQREALALAQPAVPAEQRRRRGRPLIRGTGRGKGRSRSAVLSQASESCSALRRVGPPCMQAVVHACTRPHIARDNHVDKMLEYTLGIEPRSAMPIGVEAKALGVARQLVAPRLNECVAAAHLGSRAWTASLLSYLLRQTQSETVRPVCSILYTAYDETTSHMRAEDIERPPPPSFLTPLTLCRFGWHGPRLNSSSNNSSNIGRVRNSINGPKCATSSNLMRPWASCCRLFPQAAICTSGCH